jgi:Shikimate 5-dehydrogenase
MKSYKFCLIGGKLAHSYSALIHREFGYPYELVELKKEELAGFVSRGEYDGFNVTIPYKKDIIPLLSGIDDLAAEAGAVNTVVKRNGGYYGYNTDVPGMAYMLEDGGISLKNKKTLILGTGGTSATALALARREGAREIAVVGRTGENNYGNLYKHYDAEIIVNATPVGMYPENGAKLVDLSPFKNLEGVADAIYNPISTNLIFDARERGIKCRPGLKMLVAQAKYARDLFLGEPAKDEEIKRVYKTVASGTANVVLIGMPSSGKSTVGAELAKRLKKKFIDLDEEIVKEAKKPVPEIFEEDGEPAFRALESKLLEKFCKESGLVIATGGGAIKGENAYRTMKQNGIIVFLKRDGDKANYEGRPLLKNSRDFDRLYAERLPLYNKFADFSADNDGDISQTVNFIVERFYENFDY